MELKFQCNYQDYLEAQRAHASFVGRYLLPILGILFVALGTVRSFTENLGAGAPLLAIGVFWLGWGLFCRTWYLRRDFRKNPNFVRDILLVVKPDGLGTATDVGKSDTNWTAYTKFKETPNLFMLYLGGRIFRVIPKRAFAGPQLDQFRDLLRQNLKTK
jgi:hypothetical protein